MSIENIRDPHLAAAIPEDGYIREYLEFASKVTMSPPEYHLAGSLCQMSSLMSNRIKFPLGGRGFPAHLWAVLLGRAGESRKSSAISLAFSMLDEARPGLRLPQETTREALWVILRDQPTGFLELSEFMAFMERSRLEYMRGLVEDLCDFFDCPREVKRQLKTESYQVEYPSITILGAGVTDVLGDWFRKKDLTGGFLSRFLLVPQSTPVEYVGMRNHKSLSERDELVDHLRQLSRNEYLRRPEGAVMVDWERGSPEALEVWETYDRRLMQDPNVRIPELSGFLSRAGVYAAKLAMAYAFSEGRVKPSEQDARHAVAFVEYCRTWTAKTMEQFTIQTPEGKKMQRIQVLIERHGSNGNRGWARRSQILKDSHLKKQDFNSLIETMQESGVVEVSTIDSGEYGANRQRTYSVLRLKEQDA